MTERAQRIVDATMNLTLRPRYNDRTKVLATAIRECADELCLSWGELQHPATVLREIADEIEEL